MIHFTIFYGWWIVFACFCIAFTVSGIVFYGFTAFFEPIVKEFGWNYTQVSFAYSLRGMEMGLVAPLVGLLADWLGTRKLLLISAIMVGAGLVLLSYTQSLLMFYGAMLLIAFGGGSSTLVTTTAVAQWFYRDIGKAMAVMSAGFGASGLLLPLIVGVVDLYGWRTALLILGISIWLVGVPLALVVRDSPEKYGLAPDGLTHYAGNIERDPDEDLPKASYLTILKDRSFLYLNLSEVIRNMVLTSVVIHIMPYLSSVGITRSSAGLIAAAIPVLSIIGRFAFGWLCDIFNKRLIMLMGFFIMALGTLAFAFIHLPLMLISFLLLFTFGFGGLTVMRGIMIRTHYDKRVFGSMMGIMMGFAAVGGIIGPTLTGWIFDMTADYRFAWMGFCALLLLCMQLIISFRPEKQVLTSSD